MARRGYWVGKTYYNPRTGQQRSVWRYIVGRTRRHGRKPHPAARRTSATGQRTATGTNSLPTAMLLIAGLAFGAWMLWVNPNTRVLLQGLLGSIVGK